MITTKLVPDNGVLIPMYEGDDEAEMLRYVGTSLGWLAVETEHTTFLCSVEGRSFFICISGHARFGIDVYQFHTPRAEAEKVLLESVPADVKNDLGEFTIVWNSIL